MWKVAVSTLRLIAHSTVRSKTSSVSSSRPNTKLALTIMPNECTRRITWS